MGQYGWRERKMTSHRLNILTTRRQKSWIGIEWMANTHIHRRVYFPHFIPAMAVPTSVDACSQSPDLLSEKPYYGQRTPTDGACCSKDESITTELWAWSFWYKRVLLRRGGRVYWFSAAFQVLFGHTCAEILTLHKAFWSHRVPCLSKLHTKTFSKRAVNEK